MKYKIILAIALAIFSFNAFSGGYFGGDRTDNRSSATSRSGSHSVSGANSNSNSRSSVVNNSSQRTNVGVSTKVGVNTSVDATGGNSRSNAGAIGVGGKATGGNSSISIEGDDYEAAAYAPNNSISVSGPCTGTAVGGSAGITALSLGYNRAFEDRECTKRETARILIEAANSRTFTIKQTQDLRNAAYLVLTNQREVVCVTNPAECEVKKSVFNQQPKQLP